MHARVFSSLIALLGMWSGSAWAITCTGQSFTFDTPTDPQAQSYTVPSVTNPAKGSLGDFFKNIFNALFRRK